jgi:myo-inositol-1(or 4)-monophosphatase
MAEFLDVAISAARAGGQVLRDLLPAERDIATKGTGIELVTDADRKAEEAIVACIRSQFPEDAILSEERGEEPGRSPYRWIIDPLDGTTNYAHRLPIFCVSVAVETGGQVLAGAVYDPTRDELFAARRGRGATLNGRRLIVSAEGNLEAALLVTGFGYDLRTNPRNNLRQFADLSRRARGVRRLGSAALDLCYVAAGRLDGYWELTIKVWDVAAGALLVEEAGGRMSRVNGAPYEIFCGEVVATNGRIHGALVAALRASLRAEG